MNHKIEQGDHVDVFFDTLSALFNAEVLYTPVATGDAFHLRTDKGVLVYVQNYQMMRKKEYVEVEF